MARSLTNNFAASYAVEETIGVLPTTPLWKLLEPNSINTFGANITTVERAPISKDRQRRKGTVTDLDSAVEYDADWTMDSFEDFIQSFVFAIPYGTVMHALKSGASADNLAAGSALYTHDALPAAIAEDTLLYARAFTDPLNNGLVEVAAAGSTTSTPIQGGTQVAETPTIAKNASLETAGFRFADLTWTDATTTIGSVLIDLTTLGLLAGQFIRVGSGVNDFSLGAIMGRVVSISAAAIVLDKVTNIGVGTLDGGGDLTAEAVDLLYGRFFRNVSVDDSDYVEQSIQFEGAYDNLQNPTGTGPEYEYAKGNFANQVTFNMPLADKAAISFAFIGTDTDAPSTTRATGAATPQDPVKTGALNTSADIARLRVTDVDEAGLSTCFKSMSLSLVNNVSPEKCLGTLGAAFMNTGNFEVNLEAELLFTNGDVVDRIRANTTVTMDFGVENDDGAVWVDIPSMTLGGGARSFPVNESILISLTGAAFGDATLGTSLGVSLFPYMP